MRCGGTTVESVAFRALLDPAPQGPATQDRGGGKLATLRRRTREGDG